MQTASFLPGFSRRCALIAAAGMLSPLQRPARAQEAPSRPVRILVGGAPGTVMDVAARQIGEVLASQTGQVVYVENRFTAGGIVALETLKQAPPDGHTLGLVHAMQMSAAPSLFPHLPYDPVADFAPLGILFRGPQVLVLNPGIPAATWPELVALLKSRPGRYRYATPANGSPQHLTMERIKTAAGIDVEHIPYRGPAATTAVLSGEVDMMMEGVMPLLSYINAGKLRPVAIGGSQRVEVLPEVPTFEELGVPGVRAVWVGMVAPRNTPADLVRRLHGELSRAVQSPALQSAFEATGRIVSPTSPKEMADAIRREIPEWRVVVQQARITAD